MTVPDDKGVIVKVCGVELDANVKTRGVESPQPFGVMVIVPVNGPLGATVNVDDPIPETPTVGPLKL